MTIRHFLIPLAILCMLSCSSPRDHDPNPKPDSSALAATVRSRLVLTAPGFKTLDTALFFAGVWVNEIYLDSIRKNRSPRRDQGIMKSGIVIPDSTLKRTNIISGFHEGGEDVVVVKDGNRYLFYDPEFTMPKDTIEPMAPDRLRIGDQYFRRLKYSNKDKNDWGILEEILFSGKYQSEDGQEVVFGADGHIKGLDTVSYYEPAIDYIGEGNLETDRISLGRSHENVYEYSFRFNKDTLLIYRIDCLQYDSLAHECGLEKLGELRWKLKRMPG